jgi:hypothetical protein
LIFSSISQLTGTESSPDSQPTEGGSPTLIGLPTEVKLIIFKHLDRASSTCLGLTAKMFYTLHIEVRGKVPLCSFCFFNPKTELRAGVRLHSLLQEWVGPDLVYKENEDKFVSRKRMIGFAAGMRKDDLFMSASLRDKREKERDAREVEDWFLLAYNGGGSCSLECLIRHG